MSALILKEHHTRDQREERIVFAAAHIEPGLIVSATLTHQDAASGDQLASKALHTQPLAVGIASVYR